MDRIKLKRLQDLTGDRIHPEGKRPTTIIVDDKEKNLRTQSVIYPDGSAHVQTRG